MAVPIRNLYYLLCYAWDHLEALALLETGVLDGDRVEDLLGRVLHDGVRQLLKRGLDQGYLPVVEEGRTVRGKVLLAQTAQRLLLRQGKVACAPDERSVDVPHNRVIKAAMRELAALPTLDTRLRHELRSLCLALADVSDIRLDASAFRHVQLNQNLVRYSFLIEVARLVAGCLLPEQSGHGNSFRNFVADDRQMGDLFEAFVRNFLIREQNTFHVRVRQFPWDSSPSGSGEDESLLPQLKTDVFLSRAGRTVILEAKCVDKALMTKHVGTPKLRSSHLYQLLAYLENAPIPNGDSTSGVLLYAGLGPGKPLEYRLCGHHVLVRNLNLDQPWQLIRADLLALSEELAATAPTAAGAPLPAGPGSIATDQVFL